MEIHFVRFTQERVHDSSNGTSKVVGMPRVFHKQEINLAHWNEFCGRLLDATNLTYSHVNRMLRIHCSVALSERNKTERLNISIPGLSYDEFTRKIEWRISGYSSARIECYLFSSESHVDQNAWDKLKQTIEQAHDELMVAYGSKLKFLNYVDGVAIVKSLVGEFDVRSY